MNASVNILIALGAIMIFFSSLQIIDYFAYDKFKWPVRGIIVFYWALYLFGVYLIYASAHGCSGKFCSAGEIGGVTLILFGYSAVAFYILTVYSFTSLRRKMRKLNFSDKFTDKIKKQHAEAMIVFFFTTWVAAGFVYVVHHRASVAIKEAKNSPDMTQAELEKKLNEVFGRQISLKKKNTKKGK